MSTPTHLHCWRVDVLLGVDNGEEHLHKAFGLILQKDIHLADHGLLQLIHRLVLLDKGQHILSQGCRVCITPEKNQSKFLKRALEGERGDLKRTVISYRGSRWEVSQLLSSSCFSISIVLISLDDYCTKTPSSGCSEIIKCLKSNAPAVWQF